MMSVQFEGVNDVPSCHGGLENLDIEYDYFLDDLEETFRETLKEHF